MSKKTSNQTKKNWIASIILILIVVAVALLMTPGSQLGFFRLDTKELGRYALRRVIILPSANSLPNCGTDDFSITVGPQSPPEGRRVMSRNPGIATIAQFIVTPRNCKLTVRSFEFEWIDLLRTQERNFNGPFWINLNYPRGFTTLRSGEYEVAFNPAPALLCMEGKNQETFRISSRDSVTIREPTTFTVSGTLFAQRHNIPGRTPAENSRYRLKLTKIGNVYKDFEFPTQSFDRFTQVNDAYAERCASPD